MKDFRETFILLITINLVDTIPYMTQTAGPSFVYEMLILFFAVNNYISISKRRIRTTHRCITFSLATEELAPRTRRLEFVSANTTCDPQDVLVTDYHAKSLIQCARDCLSRHDCQGFGFVAAGKEDDCMLCDRAKRPQLRAGSRFFRETI